MSSNAAVAANRGLRSLGLQIREVSEELNYSPLQAVLSSRAHPHAVFTVTEVWSVGGYFPNR